MNSYFEEYLKVLEEKVNSKHTRKSYYTAARYFSKYLANELKKDWASLSYHDMEAYKEHLMEQYALSSIKLKLSGLNHFIAYLIDRGVMITNPLTYVKRGEEQKRTVKWLDAGEKRRLLAIVDDSRLEARNKWLYLRNYAIVSLFLNAGLRISEVAALRIRDVTFANDNNITVTAGKGYKWRSIPMNDDLVAILKAWLIIRGSKKEVKHDFVFVSQKGNPLEQSAISRLLQKYGKEADLPVTAHTLRHTFGHDLAERGISIQVIADLLGHASIETTRIYIVPGKKELMDGVNKLSSGYLANKYKEDGK